MTLHCEWKRASSGTSACDELFTTNVKKDNILKHNKYHMKV